VNHALRFCDEPWPQPSTHDDLHSVAVGWFDRITRADEFAALCASGPQRLFVLSFVDRQRGLVQSLFTESMRQGFCCAELCWSAVGGVELARSADAGAHVAFKVGEGVLSDSCACVAVHRKCPVGLESAASVLAGRGHGT
jgi:hypothetical protein